MPGKPVRSSFSTLIPKSWLVALGTHSGKHVPGFHGAQSQRFAEGRLAHSRRSCEEGNLSLGAYPMYSVCLASSLVLASPRRHAGSCIGRPQQGLALLLSDPMVRVIWIEWMV